ncbi:hypothetical protein GUITHDRAFT_135356 [Guillardia theta CCMP2712]|uniref:EF-hand domain-containing protein n=3 Tax=Guillardia theta TaxID=55529 RepID=L1JPH1_GUITC|nr:hypothetical protein GUITHDRAFT_135356 [Guillardia theta CCMP2712]EKX50174.1 hypothetical protein GUITHDRAFT_135356 [Guillardia theta CCMP2712]|eukprot:XP_005837154.1 hypothetical protein GUITHDRAFT_135356 [Guillardia theta CCMP2712]
MKFSYSSDRSDHHDTILSSKAQELCRQGLQEERRGNCERAEEYYRLALIADENHADTLAAYGHFLQTYTSDYDRAESLYKRSLSVNPTHLDTLQNYAVFLENVRGDMQRAEKLYNIALTMTAWCDDVSVEARHSLDRSAQDGAYEPERKAPSTSMKERRLKKYQPSSTAFDLLGTEMVSSPNIERQPSGKQIDAERRFLDGSATFMDDRRFASSRHNKRHTHDMHEKPWEGPLDNPHGTPSTAGRTVKKVEHHAVASFFYFGTPRSQLVQSKAFHQSLYASFEGLLRLTSSRRLSRESLFDTLEKCGIFANRESPTEDLLQLFQRSSKKNKQIHESDLFPAFSELVLDMMSIQNSSQKRETRGDLTETLEAQPEIQSNTRNFALDWLRQVKEIRKEETDVAISNETAADSTQPNFDRQIQYNDQRGVQDDSLHLSRIGKAYDGEDDSFDPAADMARKPMGDRLPRAWKVEIDKHHVNGDSIPESKRIESLSRSKGSNSQAVSSIMPEERFDKESLYHPTNSFFSDMKNPPVRIAEASKFSLLIPNEKISAHHPHQDKDPSSSSHELGSRLRSSQRRTTGEETDRSNESEVRDKTASLLQRLRDRFGTTAQLFQYFKTRQVDQGSQAGNVIGRVTSKASQGSTSITFEEFKATAESLGMNFTAREIEDMFLSLAVSITSNIPYKSLVEAVRSCTSSRSRDFGQGKRFERDSHKIRTELKCSFMTSLHAFVFFDIRGRDFLSKKDLALGLKRLKIKEQINLEAAFEETDLDHDGKINYKEFIKHFAAGWHPVEDFEAVQREYEKLKRESRRRWMTNDIPTESSPPKKSSRPRSAPPASQVSQKDSARRTLNFDGSAVYAGTSLNENFSSDTESDEEPSDGKAREPPHETKHNHRAREHAGSELPSKSQAAEREEDGSKTSNLSEAEQLDPRRLANLRLLEAKKKKEVSMLQEQEELIRQRQEMLEQKRVRRLMLDRERLERAKLIKRKDGENSESALRLFSRQSPPDHS